MINNTGPVRELECRRYANGHPYWHSFPSHKNCQIRGGCDLPPHLLGCCVAIWDKEFMSDLRRKADWVQAQYPYIFSAIPDKAPEPDLISRDTVTDEFNKA
ncbi:hypothetical protein [Pantoea anthophila]|uniref:hypothetical protein n=1 Tax=Pantoea anthophila TaxID=470931 RepID=UPI002DBDE11C|nr:hypothetical protein [Pantoea anthophila]MEB6222569.1 hypothetical protein [Pantoea anthophila]